MPYAPLQPHEQLNHTSGTLIDVIGGKVPVEELSPGDMVKTKDHGFQPVLCIGSRRLTEADFANHPELRPIRIKANALGQALPSHDLRVSQNHCVLLNDWRCELLFGQDEVLAPAKALLNDQSIIIEHDNEDVTYFHIMFARHEIIYSNGVETESFHPELEVGDDLSEAKRAELLLLFDDLDQDIMSFGRKARPTLMPFEVDVLLAQ